MKISLSERSAVTGRDGHIITEVLGLPTMNISKYSVAHIVVPAGSQGETRQNQFDEIVIVIRGRGVARRDYAKDELAEKDVLLLPAGTRYALDALGEEDLEVWAVCVPAYREEWSNTGSISRDWRDYQVRRGADRLRPTEVSEEDRST